VGGSRRGRRARRRVFPGRAGRGRGRARDSRLPGCPPSC